MYRNLSILRFRKNHAAGCSLQRRRDFNGNRLIHEPLATLDDDHRAIIEIGNTLSLLLARLDYGHFHSLARDHNRFHGIGQLVDIEHLDTTQLSNLVEVEIVGDDLAADLLPQAYKLGVHLGDIVKINIRHLDLAARPLTDALQDIQATAATCAFECIRRIGDMLQLLQYEDRNQKRPLDEARITDISDAAINDDAGIQQLVLLLRLCLGRRSRVFALGRSCLLRILGHCLGELLDEVEHTRQILAFADRQRDAQIAKDNAENDWYVLTDNRNLGKGIAQ